MKANYYLHGKLKSLLIIITPTALLARRVILITMVFSLMANTLKLKTNNNSNNNDNITTKDIHRTGITKSKRKGETIINQTKLESISECYHLVYWRLFH